jgi:hypothetical protein
MCWVLPNGLLLRPKLPAKFIEKEMGYLSPEIEVWSKKLKKEQPSLVKKGRSCGIFQDYETSQDQTEDQAN